MFTRQTIEDSIAESGHLPEAAKGLLMVGVSMTSDAKIQEIAEACVAVLGDVIGHTIAAYVAGGLPSVGAMLRSFDIGDELVDRVIEHADRIIG
jgi:hypothetical protein